MHATSVTLCRKKDTPVVMEGSDFGVTLSSNLGFATCLLSDLEQGFTSPILGFLSINKI